MKKNLLTKIILFVIVIGLILSGCSSTKETDRVGVDIGNVFPLTIIDSYDNEVVINEVPNRVISIAPSITETIFALGTEEKLVGRTNFCNYPVEVENIESIGTLRSPNIERIIELEPDLIIASTHFEKEVYDKLSELEIKVIVLDSKNTLEGVYDTIERVGRVLNASEVANELIADMKSRIQAVVTKAEGQDRPEVYYVVGFGESGDFTAGGGTFINDMIEMAGAVNIAKEVQGWKYSLERLVEQDPELLIVSKHNNVKEEIKTANGYMELTAVKEGMVFEIDNNLLDRQGPRIAEGIEALAKIFHPSLFE